VKIVVQVKLMPQAAQATALSATLHTVNEAANWVSAVAYECGVPREYELRKHTYAELKARGGWGRRPPSTSSRRPVTPTPH
jgi:hypothetical protein